MQRSARSAVAAVAATALLAGACGNDPGAADDPRGALTAAFEATSEWEGVSVTVGFDFDEDAVAALADTSDEDRQMAAALRRSTLTLSSHPGEDPEDVADDVTALAVEVAGIDAFEVRSIRGDVYLRADVRALVAEFAPDDAARAEIEDALAEATVAAQGFGIDFLDVALDGAWLQLQGLDQVASMLEGLAAGGGGPAVADLDAAAFAEELSAAFRTLVDEVAVTFVEADAVGDHVQVTVTGEQLVDAFTPLVERFAELVDSPFLSGSELVDEFRSGPGYEEFAGVTIPVEVWMADGELAQVGLDMVQFAQRNPDLLDDDEDAAELAQLDRFLVTAGLSRFDGDLEAPADALAVDLFDLVGRAMSGFGGLGFGA